MANTYDNTKDPYKDLRAEDSGWAMIRNAVAVTPSDTTDFNPYPKALYVSVAGDLEVLFVDSDDAAPVTIAVSVGHLPWRVRRVLTGTSATVFAMY